MYKLVSRSRSLMESKDVSRHAAAKVTHVPNEPLHGGPETVSDTTLRTPSYNGFVTPIHTSTNAHEYAHRPLPATPPSRAKMGDRPSTSGGPGSRKTAKPDFQFDKRVSRDDFYLGSRAYGGARSGPLTPFRGQPPTPDSSPKTASVRQFSGSKNRESSTNPAREIRDGGIGMALGSPTHPPNFPGTWNTQNAAPTRKDSHPIATPPASRSSSVDTFDMPISRKPSGKWKLFSLFARKQSDQPVPAVSISDPNGLSGTSRPKDEAVVASQTLSSDARNPARSNTTSSRKTPKHKPIVVRSQTMPLNVDQKPRAGEKQGDGQFGRIPIALDTNPESSSAVKPLLNVEIPDVRLERYSVMFDGVLKSNPSLLSRRQATMPKLKSIDDAVERGEREKPHGVTRRATSPRPATRSSGLALFPTSKQSQNHIPPKLSPRLRSNTSPALLPSPSKATFDRATPSYRRPSVEESSSLKPPRYIPHQHDQKRGIVITAHSDTTEQETSPQPHQFNNDQSNLILDSPSEIESVDDEVITSQVWKPVAYQLPPEPKWQMISPSQKTPSTASSYTSSNRKRSPSLASSHITRPSEDSDDAFYLHNTSDGSAKMTPVELSIARQISMSREQRKLLQPLRTGPPPPPVSSGRRPSRASPARTSPMTGVAVGESGRIAETKTSTPTLVHPPDMLDSHLTLAQHRRSERVVLEDA